MRIQKLTITTAELCQAVQAYLVTQGVNLPVASVEKEFSYRDEFVVEFEEPKPASVTNLPEREENRGPAEVDTLAVDRVTTTMPQLTPAITAS